ncbi:hypothetical protein K7X08_023983 [Anisodus acutangulus]|uniref:Uncharacterized protein n=1 Tax=Anisodus acutangulus TaxID=402998 RepID=A0A9Q1M6W7_9SOLA|nr:hypothetical protein K7X08_023983 [Anisodus acutangulus]
MDMGTTPLLSFPKPSTVPNRSLSGSLQQAEDSSNLPEKDNLELENDEDVVDGVEDDEEIEEEVVDRGMESERAFQDSASVGSGDMIRKNIFEAVFHEIYGSGSVYLDQPEYFENGFLELMSQRETNDELKAVEFVEDTVGLLEVESAEMEKSVVHGDEEEETMSIAAGEVTSSNEVDEEEVKGSDAQLQKDPNMKDQIPFLDDISSTCTAHSSYKFEQAEADNKIEQKISEAHLERTTPAIGSITQASSLCGPTKEALKGISHISAPKIELLGEMMVREVSSSSLRSRVKKNSFIEAEGSNTNSSKVVLPPSQPSVVDLTDSPSYGSFTAEKKDLKEKGGERWRRGQEGGVDNPS